MENRLIPAPFGDSLTGSLNDVKLAGKAIRQRYPIGRGLRRKMIVWLRSIAEGAEDERARVAAIKILIEADKLNLKAEENAVKADAAVNPQEINLNVSGQIEHKHGVFERIAVLTAHFDAQPQAGVALRDGVGKHVDTRPH